jgi:MFS family permease
MVQFVYNGGDALLSWFGRHYDASNWQVVLQIGGVGALCAALVVWWVVPSDRAIVPWGGVAPRQVAPGSSRFTVRELFIEGRWALTLRLALLCGLNFFAFQAFNGWVTTFLREEHGYSPDLVGRLMTVLHVGSMIGAVFWGLLADRLGRRASAAGFALSAVFIVLYINVPGSPVLYALVGFAYGFGLVCSGVWGPYFAELYPEHLRATAASIFNWGRIVSLFGAVIAGAIAEAFGLRAIMYVGAVTFALATVLWWSLPETLPGRARAAGPARSA